MMSRAPTAPAPIAVLGAIARGVLGDRFVAEVPHRMADTLDLLSSEAERKQVLGVLRALDTRAGATLFTGKPIPVSWMTDREVESLLQAWKKSRVAAKRTLAAICVTLATNALYGHPNPEWPRIGYSGPAGEPPREPKKLSPIEITSDEHLRCDVVVVGSGAGGGCVAAGLAEQGLDVIVVDKGGYWNESDFSHLESNSMRAMYLYGASMTTVDQGVRIIAGSTLGGGTVVNYTTSFRPPDFVKRQWAELSGIDAFVSGEFDESLDAVSKRLNVNTDSSAAGRRDAVMEEGLKKLGWHVDQLPRAVRGCTQDEACGYCGFGCRVGAKQSTLRTYLEDASAAGARFIVGCDVREVIVADGRAVGINARVGNHRVQIRARGVVAAAGAIETPALLLRSGLSGQVGRNLHLHPGTAAWALFDDDIHIWEGTLQARYSSEFRHLDGGYGPIFETVPVHPGAGAGVMWWGSQKQHSALMERYGKVSHVAVLPRDQTRGRVQIDRNGAPRVKYELVRDDERRLVEGLVAAGKVLEAAGANRIWSPHPRPASFRGGADDGHEGWAHAVRKLGLRNTGATLASYHQMSSCRMGVDPATSAVGPDNQSHEVKGLFVVDASTFPDASGVNPMLSVYGIAHRATGQILSRLA